MLEEEAVEVVKQFDLLADYREAVLFVLNYVQTNKHLLCCAYDSMGREEMKRFFCADFIGITQSVICDTERQMGIHAEEQFKEFLSHFYTEAIAGLLIGEFTNKEDRRGIFLHKICKLPLNKAGKNLERCSFANFYEDSICNDIL